jgi:hypothetical protein
MTGVVEADRFREAERRYFGARFGEGAAPTPPSAPADPPRTAGQSSVPDTGSGPWDGKGSAVLGVFPEGQR